MSLTHLFLVDILSALQDLNINTILSGFSLEMSRCVLRALKIVMTDLPSC